MVTQRDIARIAGVDQGTVSYALHGKGTLSKATRDRVLRVSRRLKYRPNANALSLRTARSDLIGLVIAPLSNPFQAQLAQAMADAVGRHGCRLMLSVTWGDDREHRYQMMKLLDQRAAGVIVAAVDERLSHATLDTLRGRMPLVVLGPPGKFESVWIDKEACGHELGKHLLASGRRRIVAVVDRTASRGRYDAKTRGLSRALRDAGQRLMGTIELDRSLLDDPVEDWGCLLADHLLERYPHADAAFAGSDVVAISLVSRLLERGVRVPADIAVAGFDDIPQARWAPVPLTTIRQPIQAYAAEAARLLFDQLDPRGDGQVAAPVRLACDLVVRASTDPTWRRDDERAQ